MSKTLPLASIIIDNYNYGRLLKDAIDSTLAQTYRNTEVIVVDDGSTDNSREIIAGYGDRIIPVLKENGGQASALNAGFAVSQGDVILFLDADDVLLPTAAENAMPCFKDSGLVKVHWPLWLVDQCGLKTGQVFPAQIIPDGDLRDMVQREGLTNVLSPVLAAGWSRRFLSRILPIPEQVFTTGADTYLLELAPFLGPIKTISEPQGLYRQHGKNFHNTMTIDYKLNREMRFFDCISKVASQHCRASGLEVDIEYWKQKSWWHRQKKAIDEITMLPEPGSPIILVDDETWEVGPVAGRQRLPVFERDGRYWGPPSNDEEAIGELERLRCSGAAFAVFAWPAFWWLDHYSGFHTYLRATYSCALENDRLIIFSLCRRKAE